MKRRKFTAMDGPLQDEQYAIESRVPDGQEISIELDSGRVAVYEVNSADGHLDFIGHELP